MEPAKRIKICKLIGKMERQKDLCNRMGVRNASYYKKSNQKKSQ